jgi:hypothetical protein
MIPIGAPGVTQTDLQVRLPRVWANVIGRIVESAAGRGNLIRDTTSTEIRYWRPSTSTASATAA